MTLVQAAMAPDVKDGIKPEPALASLLKAFQKENQATREALNKLLKTSSTLAVYPNEGEFQDTCKLNSGSASDKEANSALDAFVLELENLRRQNSVLYCIVEHLTAIVG